MAAPKSTEVMEYTYARKCISPTGDNVRVAHIWEVAGNQLLADELTGATESNESFILSMRTITTSVVMIVVDLSDPYEVLSTLMPWLEFVRRKAEHVHQRLESRGSKLPQQLKAKLAAFLGRNHEDIKEITNTGVSIIIVANKYDTFKDEDPEIKRVMSRVLRHAAHRYGASIVYTSANAADSTHRSGSRSSGSGNSLKETSSGMESLVMALNHLLFVGAEKKVRNIVKPPLSPSTRDRCAPAVRHLQYAHVVHARDLDCPSDSFVQCIGPRLQNPRALPARVLSK